jgi:hypothetical protein
VSKPDPKEEALAAAIKYLKADRWLKDSRAGADAKRASLMRQAGFEVVEDNGGFPTLEYTGKNAESVIALAVAGDKIAHQALCLVALRLTDQGKALPLVLQKYIDGTASKLKYGKRGNPALNSLRDDAILDTIEIVVGFGFNPRRNAAHKDGHKSACSIVSRALGECGIARSEAAVETIWKNRRDAWKKAGIAR